MARETLGFTRLEWICPNCKNKNPGPEKTCTSCGAPQPENVEFLSPAQDQLISSAAEIEAAKLGPDIHCPYCGTRNPANSTNCRQCGGDLKGGVQRASGQDLGALNQNTPGQVKCPSCGSPNPATASLCTNCGASLTTASQPTQPQNPNKKNPVWLFILGALLLICLIASGIWVINKLNQRADLSASVQSVSWQRTITIEKYGPVSKSGWKKSIPVSAILGSCEWRVSHTQDQPAPNADKVCSAPQKIDKGNGYSEVVQDCQYQVKEEYCNYTVDEWSKLKDVVAQGSDLNPYWPDPNINDKNLRQGSKDETYSVTFKGNGKDYTYHPDLASFSNYTQGSKWKLTVNGFDSIVTVAPE